MWSALQRATPRRRKLLEAAKKERERRYAETLPGRLDAAGLTPFFKARKRETNRLGHITDIWIVEDTAGVYVCECEDQERAQIISDALNDTYRDPRD